MITFTRAPTVEVGEACTSTQLSKLADAFNDRLRSGLGDGTWRIHFYLLSLFKQVRNPSALLFPSLAEFFDKGYQMLEPNQGQWPVAGPGQEEGANLTSQMMAYVFGNAAMQVDAEDVRLTDELSGGIPLWINGAPPVTDADLWGLAKLQRGGYDPDTGALASPAWAAARSHTRIAYSSRSPHGNAYGSWLPTPEILVTPCDDPDPSDDFPPPTNYEIKFTNLVGGANIIYPGTCQPVPNGNQYQTHVAWISYTAWAYYVWKNNGSLDILPTTDYLEGPYTGQAKLRKTANNAINRAFNKFAGEFRGSDSQRSVSSYWLQEAFDTQRFLTSQYHLAANIGVESGGNVTTVYPLFRFAGSLHLASGTLATHVQSSTTQHAYETNFVITGCLITATKLSAAVTIELLDNATIKRSITITPDANGNASQLVLLVSPFTAAPLKFRLATAADFTDGSGKIEIECTELSQQKPTIEELFLTLRCGGALDSTTMDGRGIDEEASREISSEYFERGCVTNHRNHAGLPGQINAVNSNAVFDAARRLSQFIRILPRQQFVGYAVESGKSICWFKRHALIGATNVDLFAGIAGAIDHTADAEGFTNEWLMGVQFKAYHTSASSIWKASAYSDYWPFVNRCHFYSPEIANDPQLLWHVNYGRRVAGTLGGALSPESPSGWNYAPLNVSWLGRTNVNKINCNPGDTPCEEARRNFYKSCRLYEPDVEIESAVSEMDGGTELVKVTFTGRFHHYSGAPASIDRAIGTWDLIALNAEPYRTVENGLRQYLVNQQNGTNPTAITGDNSANSTVQSLPDNPFASVYPHFLFTKLVPKPYADTNDEQNSWDTPMTHDVWSQMEIYLRAMCEGYVDGKTSADYACQHGTTTIFDYTFQSLCFDAFGNRWFNILSAAFRPDNPEGFGPLANTCILAASYNQFSAAINKLTRVRVMLPMTLEVAGEEKQTTIYVTPFNANGTPNNSCVGGSVVALYWDGTPTDGFAPFNTPVWSEGAPILASVYPIIDGSCDPGATGKWALINVRLSSRVRWRVSDPDSIYAIPDNWQDMLQGAPALLAEVVTSRTTMTKQLVTDINDSQHCCFVFQEPCPGFWFHDPDYWLFPETTTVTTVCSIMPNAIEAPAIGDNTVAHGHTASGADCNPGPINLVTVTPINDQSAMIEVPLV